MSVALIIMAVVAVTTTLVAIRERRAATAARQAEARAIARANRPRREMRWSPETVATDAWRESHLLLPSGHQVVPRPESLKGLQYWEVELLADGAMTRST